MNTFNSLKHQEAKTVGKNATSTYFRIKLVQRREDIQVMFYGISHFFVGIPLLYSLRQTKALLPIMLHLQPNKTKKETFSVYVRDAIA